MRWLLAAGVLAMVVTSNVARAEEPAGDGQEESPSALFASANEALKAERHGDAIARFEALADRGVVDAAVSYDRGLAYAARVRAKMEQPGDLGRAAHGFEEARELTHDRALARDATAALGEVRAEVARRRARGGEPIEMDHGASPLRAIVRLLAEDTWMILAGVLAFALSVGIIVRAVAKASRAKVAGTTTLSVSGVLLLTVALVMWAARDDRLHLREGIIVVPNARLLDDRHIALGGAPPLPEGARVRLLESAAEGPREFTKIEFGGAVGHLGAGTVLPLAAR